MFTSKKILVISLCIGLIITCAYYLLLTFAGDGRLSTPESDQLLYLQYARNMAQGHPYVFSPGDSPSSGSTTHLYIFVLSLLYRLGAQGDWFITASYVLNGIFYIGVIGLIWVIAKKMAPKSLPLTMFMTVLSGHTASAVLKQTDIGFFTLLVLSLFASIIYERHKTALIFSILCALTRPEGFVFAISFLTCGTLDLFTNRGSNAGHKDSKQAVRFLTCGIAGIITFFVTLGINKLMTGHAEFMSVANKGYFKNVPFSAALQLTLINGLSLLKGVFLGLQENFRQFYAFPQLSGFFGICGILMYQRKHRPIRLCECWFFISFIATLALVASSQFAGISNDRYLGWIFPIWIIYITIGWDNVSSRLKLPYFRSLTATILLGFQILSLTYIATTSYTQALALEYERNLGEKANLTFDPSTTFGSTVGSRINYFMPQHRIFNLCGITSPDFFINGPACIERILDQLKHEKHLRFDYWISSEEYIDKNPWVKPFTEDLILQDQDMALTSKNAFGIYKANWNTLEGGDTPCLVGAILDNLTLLGQLDIGYIPDEMHYDYTIQTRLKNTFIPMIAKTDELKPQTDYSETGRIILGSESFNVQSIQPEKDFLIILRTGLQADGKAFFGPQLSKINKLELNKSLSLRLFIDKNEIQLPAVKLRDNGFSEVVLTIPKQYINTETPRITIVGDHISYAYWFYQ